MKKMFMGIAATLFGVFFFNVLVGSFAAKPYLNDVSEMLLLLVAVLFFVVAIIKAETAEKDQNNQQT